MEIGQRTTVKGYFNVKNYFSVCPAERSVYNDLVKSCFKEANCAFKLASPLRGTTWVKLPLNGYASEEVMKHFILLNRFQPFISGLEGGSIYQNRLSLVFLFTR